MSHKRTLPMFRFPPNSFPSHCSLFSHSLAHAFRSLNGDTVENNTDSEAPGMSEREPLVCWTFHRQADGQTLSHTLHMHTYTFSRLVLLLRTCPSHARAAVALVLFCLFANPTHVCSAWRQQRHCVSQPFNQL